MGQRTGCAKRHFFVAADRLRLVDLCDLALKLTCGGVNGDREHVIQDAWHMQWPTITTGSSAYKLRTPGLPTGGVGGPG